MINKSDTFLFSPRPKACVHDGTLYLDDSPVNCTAFTLDKNFQRDGRIMAIVTITLRVDLIGGEMAHDH